MPGVFQEPRFSKLADGVHANLSNEAARTTLVALYSATTSIPIREFFSGFGKNESWVRRNRQLSCEALASCTLSGRVACCARFLPPMGLLRQRLVFMCNWFVQKWKSRPLGFLCDAPRSGRPPKTTKAIRNMIRASCCGVNRLGGGPRLGRGPCKTSEEVKVRVQRTFLGVNNN